MKRLLILVVILYAVLFSYNDFAQEFGSLRKTYEVSFPEKIQKLVLDPLPAGTYSVGTGGYFTTIQSAFNKLSTDGIAGEVTLELIDELYIAPTTQYGFTLNGPIPGAGPNSRVTIKPTENKNVTIEGNSYSVLYFMNTSYVTIDGVALTGSTTLTIHAFHNAAYPCNDAIDFLNNSDHDVIQNISSIVEDYTRPSGFGFFCWSGSSQAPDRNLIQNNFVKQGGIGPYISSNGALSTGIDNIVRGNQIGSETDSLIARGIQIENCQNTLVENNVVQNLKVIHTSGEILNQGINSYSGNGDVIRNNVVHNIKSSTGYTSVGILLSGGSGSNNQVYNNMVYNISSTSPQSNSRVAGIEIWLQTNTKIYYNTVYLSGNGTNHQGSAAFYIYGGWGNSTNVDLRNNILVNTRDESPYCASAIYDYNTTNLTSDYNDLYFDDTNQNNCLVRISSTDYFTLADWQATLNDLNSITEMAHFVSPDLHVDNTVSTLLDGHAIPIAGITTDIDNDSRNLVTPDIGADEFIGPDDVENKSIFPTRYVLEQNYPNPFNPSTNLRYSIPQTSKVVIKVFDVLGNEIATLMDEEKSVGTYEVIWHAANLPSGVYFYQMKAGSFVETKKMLLLK
jgi:trimeric autotransporter adhesin